jgi:ribosomal protein L24E
VDLNGGTLAGTGTVTGAVRATEAGGSVEPAEEFGISVGSLRLNAASTFVGNNLFVPSGEVTLGGATLEIDRAWCYSCFVGVQRQLIHVGGTTPVAGTFAQMPQLARFERNGAWFEITYGGGSGNDVVVRVVEGPLPPERSGYWMLGAAGNVYRFGEAGDHGSAYPTAAANIAPSPTGSGYWLVNRDGVVFTFGDARWFGHAPALPTGEWVSSISPVPDGTGYWLFTTRGRVFAFGSARHYGDMNQMRLNAPVLGSVATPSGGGYYMVAADGGIFTFGDARFSGSMGGRRLNGPVTGLAPDPDGAGYWLVASDGGIFAFDATFRGSMGGQPLNRPVVGMVSYGDGYLMVASDGGIFNFSNKLFSGSLGATPPAQPIVAVAPLPR